MRLGDIPFDKLKVGDKIESCTGKPGVIGGLWKEGETDPLGYTAEYGGHILMLWQDGKPNRWSLTYHSGCGVEYKE